MKVKYEQITGYTQFVNTKFGDQILPPEKVVDLSALMREGLILNMPVDGAAKEQHEQEQHEQEQHEQEQHEQEQHEQEQGHGQEQHEQHEQHTE